MALRKSMATACLYAIMENSFVELLLLPKFEIIGMKDIICNVSLSERVVESKLLLAVPIASLV